MLCLISRLASDKLEKANNMSIKYYTLSFSSNIFGGGVNLSVGGGEETEEVYKGKLQANKHQRSFK